MATNYIGPGEVVDYTAGATISSGDPVVMGTATTGGGCVGIAMVDMVSGDIGAVAIEGVFTFTKATGAVIALGDTVNWDASNADVDDNAATAAAGDVENFGVAMEAAGSGVLAINIKLMPGLGTISA